MDLHEAIQGCATDKETHGYLPHYSRHLDPANIERLLEIGVNEGGSLRMWRRWLPQAQIVGLDIDPRSAEFCADDPSLEVVIEDVNVFDPHIDWRPDVVIDDGSHNGADQASAFGRWWPRLAPGGWYVVEDLETVWHDGFPHQSSAEAVLWMGLRGACLGMTPTGARFEPVDVVELHAYEQIVFMRKRPL